MATNNVTSEEDQILSKEELTEYFAGIMTSGLQYLKVTEDLCNNELKMSIGELLKLSHLQMQECSNVQQLLEQAFTKISATSSANMRRTVLDASERSDVTGVPDDLVNVSVASYREVFKKLMDPLTRTRQICYSNLSKLRQEIKHLEEQVRALETTQTVCDDPEEEEEVSITASCSNKRAKK